MNKHKRLGLKAPIGETKTSLQETAPLRYLDQKVRFSLRDCDINRFCIRKLSDAEITKFYKRLGYFEDHTIQQIKQKEREDGFSVEKKETTNFKNFFGTYPNFSTFLHFRVNGLQTPFRVFGAMKDD